MQTCSTCGIEKPLTQYYHRKVGNRPGRRCKQCISELGKVYLKRRREGGRVRTKVRSGEYSRTVVARRNWIVSRAHHYGVPFSLSYPFIEWASRQDTCVYCGRKRDSRDATKKKLSLTFDRKAPALGYVEGNIVVSCIDCNRLKSDKFTYDEMLIIGSAYGSVYEARSRMGVRSSESGVGE